MTHAPSRGGLTRRRALAGAAWSAPAVAASATAPAYAASDQVVAVDYGVFTQAFNTTMDNPNSTFFGLDSYHGQLTNTRASRTTKWEGLFAAGGGTFTPGGSVGNGLYGGAGLWFAAPHTASGEYTGTTTLRAGARFSIEYTFTFADEIQTRPPLLWEDGEQQQVAALAQSAGGARSNNPRLAAFNGAGFTAVFRESDSYGTEWRGTLDIVTTEDAVASAEGMQVFNQVLLSQVPVYYDQVGESFSLRTTVTVVDATLLLEPVNSAAPSEQNIAGLSASATITHSPA